MTRELGKKELAAALGISDRTIKRWVSQGCPHSRAKGRLQFNEDEVREWRAQRGPAPTEASPSFSSRETLAKAELARKLTLARRNELALAAERGLPDLDLDDRIRAAKTNDDLVEISKEVGALLSSGSLSPARGRAIQGLLSEARHNMKEHREVEGDDDPEQVVLISLPGEELLRCFEGLVSDMRRAALLRVARTFLKADQAESKTVDTAANLGTEEDA